MRLCQDGQAAGPRDIQPCVLQRPRLRPHPVAPRALVPKISQLHLLAIFFSPTLCVSLVICGCIQSPMLMCSGLVFHPEENVVFSATQDSLRVRHSSSPLPLTHPYASPRCLLTCSMACADGRRLRGSPVCASTRSPWPGAACTTSPPTPPPLPWYVPLPPLSSLRAYFRVYLGSWADCRVAFGRKRHAVECQHCGLLSCPCFSCPCTFNISLPALPPHLP